MILVKLILIGYLNNLINKTMSKLDKKKLKLQERITTLENEMVSSLTKKTSDTKEIDVPSYQRKISDLRKELLLLK